MKYNTKRKYNKKNKKTRRKKYKCVKINIKKKTRKHKGGATTYVPSTSNVTLPIVIDKNQVTYSCTPVPTS
jgi:hypothetical protein